MRTAIIAIITLSIFACNTQLSYSNKEVNTSTSNTTITTTTNTTIIQNNSNNQTPVAKSPIPDSLIWNEMIHDFKDVPSGPPARTKFYFINTSNKPVTITALHPGCSCTATEFTRTPVQPKDTGWVTADYKTSNTFGRFRKHIDVYFDKNPNGYHLILTGNVDAMMKP